MQRFRYRALDSGGQHVAGQLDAQSEGEAVRQLLRQGLKPLMVESEHLEAVAATGLGQRSLSTLDRIVVLRELGTLLKAGVALDEALGSLATGHASGAAGAAMSRALADVRAGQGLHDALASSGLALPPYLLTLVRVGEASGQLAQALSEGAEQLEAQRRIEQELRNALIYPCVLVFAGVLAVLIIFLGVIPKFAPLLKNTRGQVPEFSMWVIESSIFFKEHLLPIGLAAGAVLMTLGVLLSRAAVRQAILDALARAPLLGPWLRDAEVGRWATLTGTMVRNRVPLLEALRLSRGATSMREFGVLVSSAARALENGRSLFEALNHTIWIAPARLNLIKVGERAGTLDAMLLSLGQMQSDAARERQKTAMALIEPLAILLIGAVIGVLMIAVMMAITSMNTGAV